MAPGGVEPHAHLAHGIMSHPEAPAMTLGPEDDTKGMACGGTTTHIDFAYVRPGLDIQPVIEQRAARWKGNSYVDYAFHITLAGALPIRVFDQIPEAIQAGYPSFKVFTTNVLPPHPKRAGNRLDFGRIHFAMEKVATAGGIMVVHGEDEDLVQFNYERFREEGRMEGSNLHLVHTKLSELLAFRRTIALAKATGAGVYFVHTSAREGVEAIAEARGAGPADLRRDAAPVRVLQRRVLQDPARLLLAHLPVAQVAGGPGRRSGTGSCTTGSRPSPPTSTRRASS